MNDWAAVLIIVAVLIFMFALIRLTQNGEPDKTCLEGGRHHGVVELTSLIDPSPTRTRCRDCGKIKRIDGSWR